METSDNAVMVGMGEFTTESFHAIKNLLADAGVNTPMDDLAIRMMVEAYADYRRFDHYLTNTVKGYTYVTIDRYMNEKHNAYPEVKMREDAWKRFIGLCREFGFTPKGRMDLKMGDGKDDADILKGFVGR